MHIFFLYNTYYILVQNNNPHSCSINHKYKDILFILYIALQYIYLPTYYIYSINSLNNEDFIFLFLYFFQDDLSGQVLLDVVFAKLNLIETAYFGLRYLDAENQTVCVQFSTFLYITTYLCNPTITIYVRLISFFILYTNIIYQHFTVNNLTNRSFSLFICLFFSTALVGRVNTTS